MAELLFRGGGGTCNDFYGGLATVSYDIIGDIHGHASELVTLLKRMDYAERGGLWRHSSRTAVFVGDFIDRGPQQLEAVDVVRRMVEGGSALAVMGNHEFNAIAWHTEDPDRPGEHLRRHTQKNRGQHYEFLKAVERDPARHASIIDWFLTLPLWLELPGLRVVHACWHQASMNYLAPRLVDGNRLTRDLMPEASREPADGSELTVFGAIETILKGLEVPLPSGHGGFRDKDGFLRDSVRVKWWDPAATTFRKAALMPSLEREGVPDSPLPAESRVSLDGGAPVFFGHYWATGELAVAPRAVCVDYSIAKGGKLAAYRWNGELELKREALLCVEAESGRT